MPTQARSKHKVENSQYLLDFVDEYEAEIIEQVEAIYGDEMTVAQAWYVGKLVGLFGPKRVKLALKEHSAKLDPVRYAYSSLVRNQYGKNRQVQDTKDVEYRSIKENEKIW